MSQVPQLPYHISILPRKKEEEETQFYTGDNKNNSFLWKDCKIYKSFRSVTGAEFHVVCLPFDLCEKGGQGCKCWEACHLVREKAGVMTHWAEIRDLPEEKRLGLARSSPVSKVKNLYIRMQHHYPEPGFIHRFVSENVAADSLLVVTNYGYLLRYSLSELKLLAWRYIPEREDEREAGVSARLGIYARSAPRASESDPESFVELVAPHDAWGRQGTKLLRVDVDHHLCDVKVGCFAEVDKISFDFYFDAAGRIWCCSTEGKLRVYDRNLRLLAKEDLKFEDKDRWAHIYAHQGEIFMQTCIRGCFGNRADDKDYNLILEASE